MGASEGGKAEIVETDGAEVVVGIVGGIVNGIVDVLFSFV